jgi:hypothetical protein
MREMAKIPNGYKWADTHPRRYWMLDEVPKGSKHPLPTGHTCHEPYLSIETYA